MHKTKAHANPMLHGLSKRMIGWMSVVCSYFFLSFSACITWRVANAFSFGMNSFDSFWSLFRSLFQFHCIRSISIQNHMDLGFVFICNSTFLCFMMSYFHPFRNYMRQFWCTCVGIMLMQNDSHSISSSSSSIIVPLLFSKRIRGK